MTNSSFLHADNGLTPLVQALLDNTSSVIYVKDSEYRYLLVNRQFETLFHLSREEILGKNDFDIFPSELAEGFRTNDSEVMRSGNPIECEEIAPQDDGHHTYLSLKFPLRNSDGLVYAVAGISTDVTERIRHQKEIASLQDRQHLILESVVDGICGFDQDGRISFLNLAAERMLQWTTSELCGQCHSQIMMSRKTLNWASSFTQADSSDSNTDGQAGDHGASKTSVLASTFRRRDGSALPVEYTVAPIRDHQSIVGAVVAFRDTTERLKQIAIEQEIQTARRIQISLTPKRVPKLTGFDFAAASIPCTKACGDYYDFVEWGDGRLGLIVGDVSGHGLGAALEMVETRAILRTTMLTESQPVYCMTRLNEILTEDLPDEMFVTLFLAALDVTERTFTYTAAGHDAILIRANGEFHHLDSTGTVLGLDESAVFTSVGPIALLRGDILLLATDGIAETVSPTRQLFGRNRILDLLRSNQSKSAAEILYSLRVAIDTFRERELQTDDVTAIVVKVL